MQKLVIFIVFFFVASFSVQGQDLWQVYELALNNDAQIRAAQASKNAALESRPQARASLFPSVSLTGSVSRSRLNTQGVGRENYDSSRATLNLSQPVYRRDHWVRLRQADDVVAQAEASFAAEEQNLILRVAEAYFNVLLGQDNLQFSRSETKAIGRQLEQSRQRYDVGLVAITDVHEAQAVYDQSRADLIAAESGLDNAWEALREVTGVGGETTLSKLASKIPLTSPEPKDIEQWSQVAQQQNLGLQVALKEAEIAKHDIDVQSSGHYPTLDLVGIRNPGTTSTRNIV